jgi:hypothetical protein
VETWLGVRIVMGDGENDPSDGYRARKAGGRLAARWGKDLKIGRARGGPGDYAVTEKLVEVSCDQPLDVAMSSHAVHWAAPLCHAGEPSPKFQLELRASAK